MNTIIVDFSQCTNAEDLHCAIQRSFEFPAFYGQNLDAIWDCLTGFIEPLDSVELRGFSTARGLVGAYAVSLLDVLQRYCDESGIRMIVD